ncbi:DUF427 domain protein [Lophiostoma macrostomum CBS 122681]|uniref:DUF427 domain protein n=1 Tax=Lophiostoma macrostomum CBS 122681 TaxID=1314788 RepID=A0A6A6T531_9PLEO|nr:DUF427 domain protein [Lophiostoma macrostomum CBS 122681]
MPATATVNGVEVARADTYEIVDGNIYFPPTSLTSPSHLTPTSTHTHCPYKGEASYYSINAGKTVLKDAAWYYPEPKPGMEKIRGYVAFYKTKPEIEVSVE